MTSRPSRRPAIRSTLRLLATTDVHVHLLGYDYFTDRPSTGIGLAHTAALIAQARAEVPNVLLFDNGDFLQGNPLGDYIMQSGALQAGRVHPAVQAMNRLGYDAATLGNHEFNYGLDPLLLSLGGAGFPIVSANVARRLGASPTEDDTLLPPFVLLKRTLLDDAGGRHPITIGVIGFAPPQIVDWDRLLLAGALHTRGIAETAAVLVPRMRALGADLVVALSHSGIGALDLDPGAENATTALATVPGIDAIIAGHSHLVFPSDAFAGLAGIDVAAGRIMGTPAVMPGFNGSHLGVIDLDLAQGPDGWQVRGAQVAARPVQGAAALPPAPEVLRAVNPDHAATLAYARRPVGASAAPLHSYFVAVAANLPLRVVAQAQADHVRHQLQGRPEAQLPVLSAVSPFRAGGRGGPGNYIDIPAGPLALRNVAELYLFPNTIAALRLTGAELQDWLENAMGLYRQITPGLPDQPLIDDDFPSYNHDRILGVSFAVDLTQPARYDRFGALADPGAQRVRDLRFAGQPIDPAAEFVLATNSYRAAGCGGYHAARADRLIDVGRATIRDILLRCVADQPPIVSDRTSSFHLLPVPGASVLFDTGPGAQAHLADIAHFAPEPLGLTEAGFLRFRLHL
ncbi:2',3'-cyclic-nucleotide 2'-phosphodiesterase / 3'-nucleotidase [Gemmobacter aquatilis]|uniref:2',3'-cyclic-nucleotide 2'-phosphodiesterase / 3'-nucleotidase n=1 Tax=Gemmobacter aquatilis TaxID=933059 RepID=A0A1H8I8G4_9RHOB|nr:bifunctional 2',3'-cyclic-nucleotide 2'-phosphodiesterase/3'-nucleotidase [Gemmobacter aquatilis]SEN65080.1 2',3'-cyclic-nucleotide 2'-phosphodiesterase / 3'-nucleotidase [Gemmobacter aquatilis]